MLCWAIIFLLYIITLYVNLIRSIFSVTFSSSFIPSQWRYINIAMVYYCFVVFLCFLLTDECDHLLVSPITSEVFCWAITLSLYNKLVFNPERKNIYMSMSLFRTRRLLYRLCSVILSRNFITEKLRHITVVMGFLSNLNWCYSASLWASSYLSSLLLISKT